MKERQPRQGLRSEAGGVALMYALVFIALASVVGLSIDMSRATGARAKVQAALDAASLAGARAMENPSLSDRDIKTLTRQAFEDNLGADAASMKCAAPDITVERAAWRVGASATCDIATTLSRIAGRDSVTVGTESVAVANLTRLDVALMLDVSGSMAGKKLDALKTASKEAAAILLTPETGDRVRIGFASYASSINAGAYAPSVKGPGFNIKLPGASCVSERPGMGAWKDKKPGLGNWLGTLATDCPASSVLPITADKARFNAAIDTLVADGMTAGHLGIAWSWYLISPEWADIWPAESAPLPYGQDGVQKVVILMTDGMFNTAYAPYLGNSEAQARKLCREMEKDGITIFAVAFEAPNDAKDLLRKCAGSEDRFFDARNPDELLAAYRAIASRLSGLRLTN